MSQLLIAITHDMSPGQIDRIMDELDSEKRGEITFEDFYTWCHARIRKCNHTTNSLIHEVFYMVDVVRKMYFLIVQSVTWIRIEAVRLLWMNS